MFGLATPDDGGEEKYADRLMELAEGIPTCFFVHNGSLFIGDLMTPDAVPGTQGGQDEEV